MTIRFGSVVINCRDMGPVTAFWSAALDLVPSSDGPADGFRVLRGDRVNVSLQVAETPVGCRDQMHLDLYSPDQAAEVERLMSLGAEFIRHVEHPEDDYVVLADPENNLFCVCLDAPRG